MDESRKAWQAVACGPCGGHGVVAVYSSNDFLGPRTCGTCDGAGEVYQTPKGRLIMYPGGPFVGRLPQRSA